MSVSFEHYPTGDTCSACGEPIGYRAKMTTRGGRLQEIGHREGPACWNDECECFHKPID